MAVQVTFSPYAAVATREDEEDADSYMETVSSAIYAVTDFAGALGSESGRVSSDFSSGFSVVRSLMRM